MSLIETIFKTSRTIPVKRTEYTVLSHAMAELGELAEEVTISCGESYKTAGPDGVIGESIDTIICLVDMIHVHAKNQGIEITEEQLIEIAKKKLAKWESKCQQHTALSDDPSTDMNPSLAQIFLHKMKLLFSTKNESK